MSFFNNTVLKFINKPISILISSYISGNAFCFSTNIHCALCVNSLRPLRLNIYIIKFKWSRKYTLLKSVCQGGNNK